MYVYLNLMHSFFTPKWENQCMHMFIMCNLTVWRTDKNQHQICCIFSKAWLTDSHVHHSRFFYWSPIFMKSIWNKKNKVLWSSFIWLLAKKKKTLFFKCPLPKFQFSKHLCGEVKITKWEEEKLGNVLKMQCIFSSFFVSWQRNRNALTF